MAAPYAYWPGGMGGGMPMGPPPIAHPGMGYPGMGHAPMGGMMHPYAFPHNIAYAIPSIPPSSK